MSNHTICASLQMNEGDTDGDKMDMIEVLNNEDTVITIISNESNFFHARYELHGRFFVLISGLDQAGGDYTSFWEEDENGNEFVNNDCPTCGGHGYYGICAKCD